MSQIHTAQLPVIGTALTHSPLPGLRFLRDELNRDPNAYLVAVWDELVHARHPVAVFRTFSRRKSVKVDVVAENGARWIRINTIKNTRLMMEFREIDSYLTSDDDEGEHAEFDNSVLRMGRELLTAASADPAVPQVTIRLTRLDPYLSDDPRIKKTVQSLCDMGIDVQLGRRSSSPPLPSTLILELEPTTNINLDLSALIALVSDTTHSPLPRTEQEAYTRFEPPQSYLDWKRDRVRSLARRNQDSDECVWENSGQHSRALAAQAIQEMTKGILQQIHERVAANVSFWTTSEARNRCLQIVSKIGGKRERRRADALLGSTHCSRAPLVPVLAHVRTDGGDGLLPPEDAYWDCSRYPAGFLPLLPVRVYPSTLPTAEEQPASTSAFFGAIAQTCSEILLREGTPADPLPTAEEDLEEIPPAAQTALPKLTVHTVTSMLAGASRGYTTLTTNRSSVRAVFKEMRRVCGTAEVGEVEKAAMWVLDPRSLSEGMCEGDSP